MNCFPTVPIVSGLVTAFVVAAGLAHWIGWPVALAWLAAAAVVTVVWLWRCSALGRLPVAAPPADVTEQLRDEFLDTLSHELRTPLNAMVGWVHLLRMKAPMDPDRALAAIERNAAHQARLIDDLLDVSRALKGGLPMALAPVDMVAITRSAMKAMQSVAGAKRIAFVLRIPQSQAMVHGDAGRLEQALRNLLSNAVKFTPSGGRVEVALSQSRGAITVEVRDSGAGVDPAFLPHMFKPFRQGSGRGQRAGLGLGLSIVEEIVRRHGGTVGAQSDGRDRGTCIRIVLPEAQAEQPRRAISLPPVDRSVRSDEPAGGAEAGRPARERSAEAPAGAAPRVEDRPQVVRASASRRAAVLSAVADRRRRQAPDITRAAH